jgi:hypothetical protein
MSCCATLLLDERNARLPRCRADRLGVIAAVLLPAHKRLHVSRADDLRLMPKCFELTCPIECSHAGFNDDGAAFDLRQRHEKLIAHHPALQDDATIPVDAMELEYILRDVHA